VLAEASVAMMFVNANATEMAVLVMVTLSLGIP
jgi:hypothetical protein